MKKVIALAAAFIVVLALAVSLMYARGYFGISADNMEKDARKSQSIGSTWAVSKSVNENLGAMIFYSDTLDEHTFSIYVSREGFFSRLFSRYYFRAGGSDSVIDYSIREFSFPSPYDKNGSALISMNTGSVAKIVIDNDIDTTVIDVDPNKPFAVVIPINPGSVVLYDVDDNIIPFNDRAVTE